MNSMFVCIIYYVSERSDQAQEESTGWKSSVTRHAGRKEVFQKYPTAGRSAYARKSQEASLGFLVAAPDVTVSAKENRDRARLWP